MSALEETESWMLDVVVRDKCIKVSCGAATQRVKWLGHVGIARYDEKSYQGWKQLGVPTKITKADGVELDPAGRVEHRTTSSIERRIRLQRAHRSLNSVHRRTRRLQDRVASLCRL